MLSHLPSDLVEVFLEDLKKKRSQATYQLYAHYLRHFAKQMEGRKIDSIVETDILRFTRSRNPLICIRSFFHWCKKTVGVIAKNPTKKIPIPCNGHREKILDRREEVRFLRSSPRALREALIFLGGTGARPGEFCSLTWEQIRIMGEGIPLEEALKSGLCFFALNHFKGKNRRKNPHRQRLIFIPKRVGRMLCRLRARGKDCQSGVIFKTAKGLEWNYNSFRSCFRRSRAKVFAASSDHLSQVVPYTLRHTFATRLASRGVNPKILAEMLGHSTTKMCEWYIHPSADDMRKWLE